MPRKPSRAGPRGRSLLAVALAVLVAVSVHGGGSMPAAAASVAGELFDADEHEPQAQTQAQTQAQPQAQTQAQPQAQTQARPQARPQAQPPAEPGGSDSGRVASAASAAVSPAPSVAEIFRSARRRALGGGLPGAAAGVVQVLALMWLRTTINYQCRYGGSFGHALSLLYRDGGVRRFYRGIGFALLQAPLTRFVATASNDGVLALLAGLPQTRDWTPAVTTVFASLTVGAFRILLMPIDTCKTVLQVDSREGFRALVRRVRAGRVGALYQGALATAVSSAIGHYPWFVIFNALSSAEWLEALVSSGLLRNAGIGLVASVVSDTVVNVFRVIKTTKQSIGSRHDFSYGDTIKVILAADGWKGLFGRGLRTRVLANAVQSVLFTVVWRGLADRWGTAGGGRSTETAGVSPRATPRRGGVRKNKGKHNGKPEATGRETRAEGEEQTAR